MKHTMRATFMTIAALVAIGLLTACALHPATLDEPTQAVVGENGLVCVSDGYNNARVAVFDPSGAFQFEWGSKGFGRGQFNTPHAIATLPDGSLLVADRGNARLQRFTPEGDFVAEWHDPDIGRPWAVAVARSGRVFVVDGGDQDASAPRSGLAELTPSGEVRCRWSGFGSAQGQLDWGHMLAATDDDGVIVADLNNRRLVRFDEQTPGQCDFEATPGWPAAELGEGFTPLGVAVHRNRLYVSAPGQAIAVLDTTTGELVDTLGAGLLGRPHGLTADAEGLWVTDQERDRVTRLLLDGTVAAELGRGS